MSVTNTPTERRWRTALIAIAVVLLGGVLAVPAYAAGADGPAAIQAAAPEVWTAAANERALTGSSIVRFEFTVPAGAYTISAKLNVRNNNNHLTRVICELRADSENAHNWDYGSSTLDTAQQYESVSASVGHTFTAAGLVKLACYHNTTSESNNATLNYVKVTAIRVNALTHIGL